jgi:hypothetical protein
VSIRANELFLSYCRERAQWQSRGRPLSAACLIGLPVASAGQGLAGNLRLAPSARTAAGPTEY